MPLIIDEYDLVYKKQFVIFQIISKDILNQHVQCHDIQQNVGYIQLMLSLYGGLEKNRKKWYRKTKAVVSSIG